MSRASVIAVEGPSCVGKTTLVGVLAEHLRARGVAAVVLPEFSESPVGGALQNRFWVRDADVPAWTSGVAGMLAYLSDKCAVLDAHRNESAVLLSDRSFLTQRVLGMARIPDAERDSAHEFVTAAERWRDSFAVTTTLALLCRADTLEERWSRRLGRPLVEDERDRLAVERSEYASWFARTPVLPVDMDAAPLGAIPQEVAPLLDRMVAGRPAEGSER